MKKEKELIMKPSSTIQKTTQAIANVNGKWQPAKYEPYQLYGIEKIKCALGFHEPVQSKKYAHTRYCFRCGKRKQDKKYDY